MFGVVIPVHFGIFSIVIQKIYFIHRHDSGRKIYLNLHPHQSRQLFQRWYIAISGSHKEKRGGCNIGQTICHIPSNGKGQDLR